MKYYHTCPYCHANLDPGEHCDCPAALEEYTPRRRKISTAYMGGYDYQMKEAAPYDSDRP